MLSHHLALDHVTLQGLVEEARAHLLGESDKLLAPVPFRDFVAQARLGVAREEHEAFFRVDARRCERADGSFRPARRSGRRLRRRRRRGSRSMPSLARRLRERRGRSA